MFPYFLLTIIFSSSKSILILSPALTLPSSISSASLSSTMLCIARLKGLAPNTGSKPFWADSP